MPALTRLLAMVLLCATVLGVHKGEAMDLGQGILSIDAKQLEERLASPKPPVLIDVRQPSEFEESRIQGAKLIPLGDLPARLAEIPKDQPVVVYCRSGARSSRAAQFLKEQGYTNVENLSGGIKAWASKCEQSKNYC